jgi:hypothetical protein
MSVEENHLHLKDIEDSLLRQLAVQDAPHIVAVVIDAKPDWYEAEFYNHRGESRQLSKSEAEERRHKLNTPHGIKDIALSEAKERIFGLTKYLDKVAQTLTFAGQDEKPDLGPLEAYLRQEHLPALIVVTKLAGRNDYICGIYTEKTGLPC